LKIFSLDLTKIQYLVVLIYLVFAINPYLRINSFIWYSISLLTFIILMFININSFRLNFYHLWFIVFLLVQVLSLFWARDVDVSLPTIMSTISRGMLLIPIVGFVNNSIQLIKIVKLFIFASIINLIILLTQINLSSIGDIELGVHLTGGIWAANSIGLWAATVVLTIFLINSKLEWSLSSIFVVIFQFIFAIVVLITGSRGSLLLLILGFLFIGLNRNRKHFIFNVTKSLILVILLFYLSINVPLLNGIIGFRVVNLFNNIVYGNQLDSSSQVRIQMIKYGLEWISKSPFLGYGINNFRILYNQISGIEVYSHSNYIELLIGIGLIGTFVYYSIFVKIFKFTAKKSQFYENGLPIYLPMLIAILFLDIYVITYNIFEIQFIIAIAFVSYRIANKKYQESI